MDILIDSKISTSAVATADNNNTTTYKPNIQTQKAWGSGYSLDIADKVMENEAYKGHGLTTDDIMQQAGNVNTHVQKDFMVVMSNCVSGEDLQKMQEEGFKPGSTDVETYVSIVDKIKVTLAKAGVEISGYNDDIDADIVEEITGSKLDANRLAKDMADMFKEQDLPVTDENVIQIAKAVMKASDIGTLSEDTIKYILVNQQPPTIENLYKAQFSSANNLRQAKGYYSEGTGNYGKYFAKKADVINLDNVKGQMENIANQAGLNTDEKSMAQALENAKWLVESGIELTANNLTVLTELKGLKLPIEQTDILKLCVTALGNGKSPEKALMTGEASAKDIAQQAKEIIENVEKISDKAIHNTVEAGEELNIKNLTAAQKQIDLQTTDERTAEAVQSSLKEVEAKRQLEEIRLMMSQDANRFLLKKGISINTVELSKLVENLKNAEKMMREALFKGQSAEENAGRAVIYDETLLKTKELKNMPLALVGKVFSNTNVITLSTLHKQGQELQNQLENQNPNQNPNQEKQKQAMASYETLMTAPRKDLGDKISKAFRNIDDILEDMSFEASEQNKRAVRILAYNRMEITEESINAVKAADSKVCEVINKMTPAATLQMIRENINPLEMTIDELDKYLNENRQDLSDETERFSKFLHKLDKSNQITKQEREAYIGIYRMFRQIEKSDGAVIGSIVATGAEMNFKNMLSAVRTRADKNMDIHIDDSFGGLEKLITKGKAIDAQIMGGYESNEQTQYYARLSGEINDELADKTDLDKLGINELTEETTIEEFADNVKMTQLSEKALAEEKAQNLEAFQQDINEAKQVDEDIIQTLIDYGQTVNLDNIGAASMLITERGSLFKQLISGKAVDNSDANESETDDNSEIIENNRNNDLWEAADKLVENLKGSKSANTAYQELISEANKAIEGMVSQNGITYIDVKAAQSLYKGLSLAGKLAREENYEIPININGEITSLNLKLCHDKTQAGKVAITLETDSLGKLAAEFNVSKSRISGMVVYDNVQQKELLQNAEALLQAPLKENLSQDNQKQISINLIYSKDVDLNKFGQDYARTSHKNANESVATSELYQTAKAFIIALKGI